MGGADTNASHTSNFDERSLNELYKPHWEALLTAWSSGDFEREPLLRYRLFILCEASFDPQLLQALPVPACETWDLTQASDSERLALTYRLASYHVWLYMRQKKQIDLRRAMELYQEAIPYFHPEDPRKIYALIDVAGLYRHQSPHAPSSYAAGLERASTLLREVLDGCAHGVSLDLADDARLWAMDRLSFTLIDRFFFI
jgi:hypothetical protein